MQSAVQQNKRYVIYMHKGADSACVQTHSTFDEAWEVAKLRMEVLKRRGGAGSMRLLHSSSAECRDAEKYADLQLGSVPRRWEWADYGNGNAEVQKAMGKALIIEHLV